jgi:hypothetical protein
VDFTARFLAPSAAEQIAFQRRKSLVLTVNSIDGHRLPLAVNSWTTAEDVIQTVFRHRGIEADANRWCLAVSNGRTAAATRVATSQFLMDAVAAMDQRTEAAVKGAVEDMDRSTGKWSSPFVFFQPANKSSSTSLPRARFEEEENEEAAESPEMHSTGGIFTNEGFGIFSSRF